MGFHDYNGFQQHRPAMVQFWNEWTWQRAFLWNGNWIPQTECIIQFIINEYNPIQIQFYNRSKLHK